MIAVSAARRPTTVAIAAGRYLRLYAEHARCCAPRELEWSVRPAQRNSAIEGTDGGVAADSPSSSPPGVVRRRGTDPAASAQARCQHPVHASVAACSIWFLNSRRTPGNVRCGGRIGAQFRSISSCLSRPAVAVVDSDAPSASAWLDMNSADAVTFADGYQPHGCTRAKTWTTCETARCRNGTCTSTCIPIRPQHRCGSAFRRTCGLQCSTGVTALRKAGPEILMALHSRPKGVTRRPITACDRHWPDGGDPQHPVPRLRSPLA